MQYWAFYLSSKSGFWLDRRRLSLRSSFADFYESMKSRKMSKLFKIDITSSQLRKSTLWIDIRSPKRLWKDGKSSNDENTLDLLFQKLLSKLPRLLSPHFFFFKPFPFSFMEELRTIGELCLKQVLEFFIDNSSASIFSLF